MCAVVRVELGGTLVVKRQRTREKRETRERVTREERESDERETRERTYSYIFTYMTVTFYL